MDKDLYVPDSIRFGDSIGGWSFDEEEEKEGRSELKQS